MIEQFIEQIPKAELQVHIEGTLEPELMLRLAQKNGITLPYSSVDEIRRAYQFQNLPSFLSTYYAGLKVLVTEQDFYDLTWDYLQKAVAQNIRHVEISFDAQAHLARGISFATIVTGIHKAIEAAEKQFTLSALLIMCLMRDLSEDAAQQVLLQAQEFKHWIVAVGLDSAELHHPPEKFKDVFARAREYGFFTVAAAGEEGPAEYIWQALDVLKVSRIGYAIHCVDDPDLMGRLNHTATPLTICPVSNVRLGLVKSLKVHPLKKMLQEGLFVTINSDNPAYFAANLTQNFLAVHAALKFTKAEIFEMVKNAFNASFLDQEKKEKYIAELDKFYKQAQKA